MSIRLNICSFAVYLSFCILVVYDVYYLTRIHVGIFLGPEREAQEFKSSPL